MVFKNDSLDLGHCMSIYAKMMTQVVGTPYAILPLLLTRWFKICKRVIYQGEGFSVAKYRSTEVLTDFWMKIWYF